MCASQITPATIIMIRFLDKVILSSSEHPFYRRPLRAHHRQKIVLPSEGTRPSGNENGLVSSMAVEDSCAESNLPVPAHPLQNHAQFRSTRARISVDSATWASSAGVSAARW